MVAQRALIFEHIAAQARILRKHCIKHSAHVVACYFQRQLATATPKEFKIKHRAQIVGRPTRSYPAIADGFAYIKGPKQLVCVDLRGNGRP